MDKYKKKIIEKSLKKDGCWIWIGVVSNAGYGKTRYEKKDISAHRLSYIVFIGSIPDGKNVCHKCDEKRCVNPEHLWLGSQSENIKDCVKKGRFTGTKGFKWTDEVRKKMKNRTHADRKGEKHHLKKLINDDIKEIRRLYDSGINQKELSLRYKVHQSCISNIVRYKSWSHI